MFSHKKNGDVKIRPWEPHDLSSDLLTYLMLGDHGANHRLGRPMGKLAYTITESFGIGHVDKGTSCS